jgi:hypothetical protein
LGTDYADAKKRCDELLNPQFDAWRKREQITLLSDHAAPGSFDWMTAVYKSSPLYRKLPAKTRKSYDAALRLASQHTLKDGRKFGMLSLTSITPGAADRLYAKLKERPDGGERVRTASFASRCVNAHGILPGATSRRGQSHTMNFRGS